MSPQLPPGKYYGETLRLRKLPCFELSERVYSPWYQTPKHTHKQALFCFVMQGQYTESYGSQTRECRSSSLLFHPPGEVHAERFHAVGGRSFIVELAPAWLKKMREQVPLTDEPADFHGGVFELLAHKLYREFTHEDCISPLIIEGLMMELVGETLRRNRAHQPTASPLWLQQVKELLQARFTENLTLTDLAQHVGVHPVYLAQTFRKTYQCTIGEYVRKLRIEYACHELTTSASPIVDIALAAGFCDQSHFTRTFKRALGAAPSQYRESLREV
ncbi:MAG: helix-turn-helix transcriptional regulator [Acidobacteria bacterium]|nr:helix-turn-helix transcriptional regulator [Acidobacteriota bacterium]MBI3424831.1 helix-turn-helix transcriptional regulator [Acidobacteriota bacterium]